MLEEIDLLRLTGDRMRYLTEQQTTIARNIANADTPGYRSQELLPFSFSSALLRTSGLTAAAPSLVPMSTHPGHIAAPSGISTPGAVKASASADEKPDGNTVSLEEQMIKSTDVANNFALASAAYSKSLTLMKIGIDFGK